jgi:hypothetical protein
VLDQQSLGALDGDRQPVPVAGELGVEIGQAGDVVGDPQLGLALADGVEDAELVVAAAPVDPGERRPRLRFRC